MRMLRCRLGAMLLVGGLVMGTATLAHATSYKVIVNNANPTAKMKKTVVSRLFFKKLTKWEHGTAVAPVDMKSSSSTRQSFSKDVLGKSISAVKAYWQKQIFSGRGVPPAEKSSDQQVVAYVRSHAGAIGYVSAEANTDGVKVVQLSN